MSMAKKGDIKELLRKETMKKRVSLNALERARLSFVIQEKTAKFIEEIKPASVLVYASYASEVDTKALMRWLLKKNVRLLVPADYGKLNGFEVSEITSIVEIMSKKKGVPVPKNKRPANVVPDVVVCPGLAFDRKGRRLGYGRGNFDRYLAGLPKRTLKIGICFFVQLLDELPEDIHDVHMDAVVTEKEIIVSR